MKATTTPIFAGSIPKHYDEFQGPVFFEDYATEIAKRIDPSKVQVVLELSSGTGRVTNHLRKVIQSTAKLIVSDISPDMAWSMGVRFITKSSNVIQLRWMR